MVGTRKWDVGERLAQGLGLAGRWAAAVTSARPWDRVTAMQPESRARRRGQDATCLFCLSQRPSPPVWLLLAWVSTAHGLPVPSSTS